MEGYYMDESRFIHVTGDFDHANALIEKCILNENVRVVGLDCEWDTNGRVPVAIIQVATEHDVIIFQVCKLPKAPTLLCQILEDVSLVKVGVDIEVDVSQITMQYDINVRGWVDLRHFSRAGWFFSEIFRQFEEHEHSLHEKGPGRRSELRRNFMPKLCLASLVQFALCRLLPKPSWIVWSAWEVPVLSEKQVEYAACDATAGLDVFDQFVKAEENYRKIGQVRASLIYFEWEYYIEKPFIQHEVRQILLERMWKYANLKTEYLYDSCSEDMKQNQESLHQAENKDRVEQLPGKKFPDIFYLGVFILFVCIIFYYTGFMSNELR